MVSRHERLLLRANSRGLQFGEELAFRVHDGFVDAGGLGGQTGNAHEVAVARGVKGLFADLCQFVAEILDHLRCNFAAHG